MSFWAGNVGFFGFGRELKVFNSQGELSPDGVRSASEQWWEYWKRYWQQKDGPTPMPKDYACEVTIPLK